MIARSQAPTRHLWLVLSIVGNVTMLGFYKYFNFLDQNIVALAQWIGFDYTGSQMNIILPIGLSFHTFQSMSYVFEVYRGRQPAERDLPVTPCTFSSSHRWSQVRSSDRRTCSSSCITPAPSITKGRCPVS